MEEQKECMIVEREELIAPPNNGGLPNLKKAHFLKPILNPQNQSSLPQHPSTYHPLNPNKQLFAKEQLITKKVSFSGMLRPLESWKSWVDDLEKTHHQLWKKVGIFDAIKASTFHIIKDNELIMGLAENWCPETSTFVFSWGESTITLEDVMILGGFSVLGNSVRSQYRSTEGGDVKNTLVETLRKIRKSKNNLQVSQNVWLNYFKGRGGELEHVALIVLWLSRYVFTSNSHSAISSSVFSIAISLTRGVRIAFAPAILAVIYRDLRLLKEKLVHCMNEGHDNGSKLVLWAPFQLLQVWVWERFPTLGPKPISLARGQPRMARWHEIKRSRWGEIRLEIESRGDNFFWRPYAFQLNNWELPKFYCDQEMWVLLNSEVDDQILSFAICLNTCELVGIDCVEQYLPQRVAMQFALDQDIPYPVPRSSATSNVAWNSYDKPLDGLKFYLPPRLCEGDVTLRYSEWWRKPFFREDNCVRRRRSTRKWKKVSKVLDTCYDKDAAYKTCCSYHKFVTFDSSGCSIEKLDENPSSSRANELNECTEINLQAEPKDNTNRCEDIVMEEEQERRTNLRITNMGEGSTPLEGSHMVGSGSDMLIDNYSLSCKGTSYQSDEYGANEIWNVTLINSVGVLQEDRLVSNGVEEEKENEFNGSYMNLNGENRAPNEGNNAPTGGKEPQMGCPMNPLSCALVRDEQDEEREKTIAKQVGCSHDDIVIISDDVGNGDCEPFEAQFREFDARINRLQHIVSALKEAKLKSKAALDFRPTECY